MMDLKDMAIQTRDLVSKMDLLPAQMRWALNTQQDNLMGWVCQNPWEDQLPWTRKDIIKIMARIAMTIIMAQVVLKIIIITALTVTMVIIMTGSVLAIRIAITGIRNTIPTAITLTRTHIRPTTITQIQPTITQRQRTIQPITIRITGMIHGGLQMPTASGA